MPRTLDSALVYPRPGIMPRELWPHQVSAIERARAAVAAGHQRVVLQVPTGGGKTVIGTEVARAAVARGKRVLWLAHRKELVDQAADTLEQAGLVVGVIAAGREWRRNVEAPVQVASLQTLLARDERPGADLIIPDECHHLSSEGAVKWTSLLDSYPTSRVLGLTATPERGDGQGLAPLFTALLCVVSVRDLTRIGDEDDATKPLVPCDISGRPDRYLKPRGVTGNPLAQDPVDAYHQLTPGTQGFLFARSVDEATSYAERLTASGVEAQCVSERTPSDVREDALARFRAGILRVLTNVYVFTEGTDLPMAETCILARGCSTAGMFLQMVGRVLRRYLGKRRARLIDLQGVTHKFGMPEDERIWRLEGRACRLASTMALCAICGKPDGLCECELEEEDDAGHAQGDTIIVDAPLTPYHRELAKGPQQRHETALRWASAASISGRKPGYIWHRYREIYGEDMPRETWRQVKEVCS